MPITIAEQVPQFTKILSNADLRYLVFITLMDRYMYELQSKGIDINKEDLAPLFIHNLALPHTHNIFISGLPQSYNEHANNCMQSKNSYHAIIKFNYVTPTKNHLIEIEDDYTLADLEKNYPKSWGGETGVKIDFHYNTKPTCRFAEQQKNIRDCAQAGCTDCRYWLNYSIVKFEVQIPSHTKLL
jgi:hypothetical protein